VGVDSAAATHSTDLLDAVREAFMSGMNLMLLVSATLMAAAAVLAVVLRPRRAEATIPPAAALQSLARS
jgi:hypothetical protein